MTTLVLSMAFHVYNARSEHRSIVALSPLRNPLLLAATAGALSIHALALSWGPTQLLLRVEALTIRDWLAAAGVSTSVVLVSELHKALRRDRTPADPSP